MATYFERKAVSNWNGRERAFSRGAIPKIPLLIKFPKFKFEI